MMMVLVVFVVEEEAVGGEALDYTSIILPCRRLRYVFAGDNCDYDDLHRSHQLADNSHCLVI